MTDTRTLLEIRETPVPEPGLEQLLVRIHAAGLNRGEFVAGHGLKPAVTSGRSCCACRPHPDALP